MAKFRKKPVVIEAFQMTKERRWDNSEWPDWLHEAWQRDGGGSGLCPDPSAGIPPGRQTPEVLCISTLEGTLHIAWNDWIIQGIEGELYPCKPDIFKATYEPVGPK